MLPFRIVQFAILASWALLSSSSYALDDRTRAAFFLDGEPVDHYAVLGIDPGASDEEIKAAFRKRAMETHPDRNPGKGPKDFQRVNFAYQLLKDPEKRARFLRIRAGLFASAPPKRGPTPRREPPGQKENTQAYKKWDPREQQRPREERWPGYGPSARRDPPPRSPDPPPREPPHPKDPRAEAAAEAYRRTKAATDSPFDKIPAELKTGYDEFWNYFAVAGASIRDSQETVAASIEAKRKELQNELQRGGSEQELADLKKRLQRLRKAREILLNPGLREKYLYYAGTITVTDKATGQRKTFLKALEEYEPQRPPARPSGSGAGCKTWFSSLFR